MFLRIIFICIFVTKCSADETVGDIDNDFNVAAKESEKLDLRTSDAESDHDQVKGNKTVPCRWSNPDENILLWALTTSGQNCTFNVSDESEAQKSRHKHGMHKYAFDVLVSDKIGPIRDVPNVTHETCRDLSYPPISQLPSASIVIVYFNEASSVLVRMINGILQRSSEQLIHEILVIDDHSEDDCIIEPQLRSYAEKFWTDKVKFRKTDKREGLIRAKNVGARMASGDVLIFLDSHCEVNENWLIPLLSAIAEDEKTVAVPLVDRIEPYTFDYTAAMQTRGGFEWNMAFKWMYFDWAEFTADPTKYSRNYETPAMSGGLLAVKKTYFESMGEYDDGMLIWGAENIEMSLRIWMCGGKVLVVPCSRVGHVFRYSRPYGAPEGSKIRDTNSMNTVRTVKIWLDDYIPKFYEKNPRFHDYDNRMGDLRDRLELRQRLDCHNFQWYIDNVYPELKESM